MLTINSNPRDPLDEDSIEDISQEDIRAIWEDGVAASYKIESDLQTYASSSLSPISNSNIMTDSNTSSMPASPNTSTPGHSRSTSISSSLSNLPPTVVQGTSIQSVPIDLLDNNNNNNNSQDGSQTLNSAEDTPTVIQYGRCLTLQDVSDVKSMVREFTTQSLIPFMERNIQHWNEQVASARRGLTGRLFGASRRLFGTSTRSPTPQSVQTIPAQGPNVPVGVNALTIYPFSAPEAQMRKLADYAFMLRDYKFAYTIYDTVRRDYATEKTYKYHAGTQEMMGICLLMLPPSPSASKSDVDRHFELAVQQYVGRCRSPFHATRTTILYYELLKTRRQWKDMPTALVRMTGEDSDLRSGLFLEQAAHCFLRAPMVRKYGFHLVMAGHRYGKAQQRWHAYRCYQLASYVLEHHHWSVAQSHIQFALGRQAFHLNKLQQAVGYFSSVLTDVQQQTTTVQQQVAHMREFLFIYKQYAASEGWDPRLKSLAGLELPVIEDKQILVTLSNAQQKSSVGEEWAALELELLEESIQSGFISSSKRAMAVQQQDDHRVVCAVGEPAIVHVELYNPLQVAITLSDLILGCQYQASTEVQPPTEDINEDMPNCKPSTTTNNETPDMFDFNDFELQKIGEITLDPLEKKIVSLKQCFIYDVLNVSFHVDQSCYSPEIRRQCTSQRSSLHIK